MLATHDHEDCFDITAYSRQRAVAVVR